MNPEDVPEAVVDAHMAWLTQERGGEDTPFLRALARARLAAVLPTHARHVRAETAEHLRDLAHSFDDLAHDGGMPGATRTGAGSPRALRREARQLRYAADLIDGTLPFLQAPKDGHNALPPWPDTDPPPCTEGTA